MNDITPPSTPQPAELLYAKLKLTHAEQLAAHERLLSCLSSPSKMIKHHEELIELQLAQKARALEIGALWLDLLQEESSVADSLIALTREELTLTPPSSIYDEPVEAPEPSAELNTSAPTPESAEPTQEDLTPDEPAELTPQTSAVEEVDEPSEIKEAPVKSPLEPVAEVIRVIQLPHLKPVDVTELDLNKLQDDLSSGSFQADEEAMRATRLAEQARESKERELFHELQSLEPPKAVFGTTSFGEELAVAQRLCDANIRKIWGRFSRKLQQALIQHLSHRLRYLQDQPFEFRPSNAQGNTFEGLIGGLAEHVKTYSLKWVNGLERQATPVSSSWLQDARSSYEKLQEGCRAVKEVESKALNPDQEIDRLRALIVDEADEQELIDQVSLIVRYKLVQMSDQRLCSALSEHVQQLKPYPEFKSLRSHIRHFNLQKEQEELSFFSEITNQKHEELIEVLADKKITLVGGDRRFQSLQRLQQELPKSHFDWIETSPNTGTRQVDSLCQAVLNGGVDVVLIIQSFVSHKVSNKLKDAVKASPTCESQMVTKGYGFSQVSMALYKIVERLKAERDEVEPIAQAL